MTKFSFVFVICLMLLSTKVNAQVGINTEVVPENVALDVEYLGATTPTDTDDFAQGVLLPGVATEASLPVLPASEDVQGFLIFVAEKQNFVFWRKNDSGAYEWKYFNRKETGF